MLKTIMMLMVGIVGGAIGSQFFALKSSSMPSGALVAFADNCPQGWQEYNQASGRMLLVDGQGEGLAPRKARETGGVDELGFTIKKAYISHVPGKFSGNGVIVPDSEVTTDTSQEIEIPKQEMPPFLVVKLCSRIKTY